MRNSVLQICSSALIVCFLAFDVDECSAQQPRIASEKEKRVIEGRVADPDGKPIEAATVEWGLISAGFRDRESVQTDADGRYRIETRNYDLHYRVGVWAEGWGPTWKDQVVPGKVDQPKSVDFTLRKPVSVSCQLIHKQTGKPIPDACVYLGAMPVVRKAFIKSNALPGPSRQSRTDADGWFQIHDLPSQQADPYFENNRPMNPAKPYRYEFQVWIETADWSKQNIGNMLPEQRKIWRDVDPFRDSLWNTARRYRQISGRVLTPAGDPITEFFVTFGWDGVKKVSSASGRFQTLISNGIPLRIFASGYQPWDASISPKDSKAVSEFRMTPVDVRHSALLVNKEGAPIANAKIRHVFATKDADSTYQYWGQLEEFDGPRNRFTTSITHTNDAGKFTYPPGCSLAIIADGYARKYLPRSSVPTENGAVLPKIELEPECRLSGVFTQKGEPCPHRKLGLFAVDTNATAPSPIYTDESGRYQFDCLQPGRYKLFSSPNEGRDREIQRDVVLDPGESKQFHLWGTGGQLELKGKAIPFSLVSLARHISPRKSVKFATTKADADGNYFFEGLPPATYGLQMIIRSKSATTQYGGNTICLKKNMVSDFKVLELIP